MRPPCQWMDRREKSGLTAIIRTGHFAGFIRETGGIIFQEGSAAQIALGAGRRLCP